METQGRAEHGEQNRLTAQLKEKISSLQEEIIRLKQGIVEQRDTSRREQQDLMVVQNEKMQESQRLKGELKTAHSEQKSTTDSIKLRIGELDQSMYEIREQLKVQRESFELELANFIELESSQACEKVELGDKKLLYEKEKLDLDEYKRIKQDMFDQRSDESQVVALRNQVEGLSTQYTIEIARLNDYQPYFYRA